MAIREVPGDRFIKFERVVHGFAYDFTRTRGYCALLPVKCAGFECARGNSALFSRFLGLSPIRIPA